MFEELARLWIDMTCILNESHVDPSYYTIFREYLERWIKKSANAADGFVDHTITAIRPWLSDLSSVVTLSTGFGMSMIWEATHPIVASTLEQWNSYSQFLALLNNFENNVGDQIGILYGLTQANNERPPE